MKRHKILPDDTKLNLTKNECLFPSIINDIINNVNINVNDIMYYHSSFNIEKILLNKLENNGLLFCDSGSERIIKQIIECLSKYSKYWVIPQPTFELVNFYCNYYNCIVERPKYEYSTIFSIDLSLIKNTSNKILYLVSPHNPTGIRFSKEELNILCENYMFVVVDEAYVSPDDILLNTSKNLIFIRTFSKMGGLTGLRFGFGICFNKKLFLEFNQSRPMYINSITLKYVEYILNNNITTKIKNKISNEIDLLKKNHNIISSAGNFVLFNDIKVYKDHVLKQYEFSDQLFYRMTLFESNYQLF